MLGPASWASKPGVSGAWWGPPPPPPPDFLVSALRVVGWNEEVEASEASTIDSSAMM